MLIALGAGVVASALAGMLFMPVSRELLIKLGTLVDMCRRANPERFAAVLAPHNPFVGGKFVHKRLTAVLKADLGEFGELCQRLQREARALDRKAHIAMWPLALYVVGLGLWFVLKP